AVQGASADRNGCYENETGASETQRHRERSAQTFPVGRRTAQFTTQPTISQRSEFDRSPQPKSEFLAANPYRSTIPVVRESGRLRKHKRSRPAGFRRAAKLLVDIR